MDILPQTVKYRRQFRGKKTQFGEKLRRLTGPVFSTQTGAGCPRMKNTKYVNSYHRRGRHFLDNQKVPYYLIQAHLEHRCKLKVSPKWGLFTLLYIDFDTHSSGSSDDVRLLAQVVRQHFPQMPEFVFNERGGSGWLVVDTSGFAPAEYNGLVRRLEQYLRSVAGAMYLNIQCVEVKGRVYEHTFHAGRLAAVKAGDLLKCPPSEAYLDQPPVDAGRFATTEFDPWEVLGGDTGSASEEETGNTKLDQDADTGSFHPRLVTPKIQRRFADLDEFVRRQFGDRPVKTGRWRISDRAFTEILLALVLLPPNADQSNPYRRHKVFIQKLYSEGVFENAYNHARYKAVRDYLSSKLAIHWQDETWRPGSRGRDGKACRWCLDPVLVRQVETVVGLVDFPEKEQDSTLVYTSCIYLGQHRIPTPVFTIGEFPEGYEEAIEALFRAKLNCRMAA